MYHSHAAKMYHPERLGDAKVSEHLMQGAFPWVKDYVR
jgi:hypothetical protein